MPDPGEASLALGLFAAAAVVILLVGTRPTAVADGLAERMGLGEALIGAVLLGAATSPFVLGMPVGSRFGEWTEGEVTEGTWSQEGR